MDNFRVEHVGKPVQPQEVQKKEPAKPPPKQGESRQVQLSREAEGIREAIKALSRTPDVRENKIQALTEAVQQGQLDLVDDLLVEKILQKLFQE